MKRKSKKVTQKKLFIVIHHHHCGTDVGLVRASEVPSEKAVCDALDFNYEPNFSEEIEIIEVNPKEPVDI